MSSDWHHLLDFIKAQHGQPLALATLIATDGSSYRQSGARLLVNESGQHCGSLSGGCLEDGIARVALDVLSDGQVRTERINTEAHFGCPGVLTILIEKIEPLGLLNDIVQKVIARETFTITTNFLGENEGFVEEVSPRPRLIVVGWTSDQDALFQLAQTLNWECHRIVKEEGMIKHLPKSANESVSACPSEELLDQFPPDAATAILIMSHHLATDLSFLKRAVQAGFPYLGLLGSKRRREKLLNELGESGLLEDQNWLSRFHAPVGLDLGATHPTTIALSIISEIQARFNGSQAGFLSDRKECTQQTSTL